MKAAIIFTVKLYLLQISVSKTFDKLNALLYVKNSGSGMPI